MHSFTEWPLLGGFGLACKPSLTFDGFSLGRRHFDGLSLGRRHDGHFRRRCPFLRTFVSFVIIIQFPRPRSPPRHNVKNHPVPVRAMLVPHHPKIPHVLGLRPHQNPAFMLASPSSTYSHCVRRNTPGHTQNMSLFNNFASPSVRGHDVERSSGIKSICLNGCGSQDYMAITIVCTFTIACRHTRAARWGIIPSQCPALPIRPARRSTRSPHQPALAAGRRGKSSLGAKADMHLQ